MDREFSFPKDRIKILLLEGIHQSAVEVFNQAGYQVDSRTDSMTQTELIAAIENVHVLGIRSKTSLTADVLEHARRLFAVGCFCIGTNQVDLINAMSKGIAVFNAPFSNTRSVAELTMAEIVMLARRASEKNVMMHQGHWDKSATHCHEVRNKTLGIIGYGHIGPQLGLLAESYGMRVVYFDIVKKLPLGTAQSMASMDELLKFADFVSLHVPETPETVNLIGKEQLDLMKQGSYLLNLSRGKVVDLAALKAAVLNKHIQGAAIDVFPVEPKGNGPFVHELQGLHNVILTPHVGGSTEEAQYSIGVEVADSLIRYSDTGSSSGAVNFPQVDLPVQKEVHRILNIHRNVPGVLGKINRLMADLEVNISAQYLNTKAEIGYLIMDVDRALSDTVKTHIAELPESIKTRVLF